MTPYTPSLCLIAAAIMTTSTGGLACRGTRPAIQRATWVHVGEIAALQGGFPTRIDTVTVGARGEIQVSRETDRDEITELRELRADPTSLFEELGRIAASLPPSPERIEDEGGVVHELLPPRLRLAIGGPDGTAVLWEGEADAAPPAVVRAIARVRGFAGRGEPGASPAPGVFVRAGLLPSAVARQLRRDGLVRNAGQGGLNPYLETCLARPFLLVRVQNGDNPFSPFWAHYQPGRGALELSVPGTTDVYQIRSLVYEAPAP